MNEHTIYRWLLSGWLVMAIGVFVALLFKTAPYGRFARPGWGPMIPGRLNWAIMESPAIAAMVLLFTLATRRTATSWAFLAIWNIHYVYRSCIFAARIRTGHRVPLFVTASGVTFNIINGCLQGWYLFGLAGPYLDSWLLGGCFWIGLTIFGVGLAINISSDKTLRSLRRPGDANYAIPRGGLFELVSCPNYLGEMIEWTGWVILTWSPPGAVFAVWTAANLLPRALACHRWYHVTFADYPPSRKALLPWIL